MTSTVTSFCLDAHTLIWFLSGSSRLSSRAKTVLLDPGNRFFLPAIALAEAIHVVARGRTNIPTVSDLIRDLDADPRLIVVPLDREIVDRSLALSAVPEMHDRLIVATTLHLASAGETVPLITCDGNITASGLVPITW